MSLSDNAHRLTEAHMAEQDGRYVKVPALLDQLDAAMTAETRAGSPSGGASPLPIGAGAYDLWRSMTEEARQYMEDLCPSFRGTLKDIVQFWATESISGEDMAFYEHVTLDWCDLIEDLIRPKKPRRKMPVPCPSCGQTYHGEDREIALSANCWDAEEELLHPSLWDVSCGACGASWIGDDIGWLRSALESGNTPHQAANDSRGIPAV